LLRNVFICNGYPKKLFWKDYHWFVESGIKKKRYTTS
jgi:hypothetical protein